MSQSVLTHNDIRFSAIFQTLNKYEYINEQLNNVNQWTSEIGDKHLANLIELSNDIHLSLKDNSLRGRSYHELSRHCSDLNSIVNISSKLEECLYDKSRLSEAVDLIERIDFLHKKYGHQLSIIEKIHKRTEVLREQLITNICSELEQVTASSNNELLTIVKYLVRCGNFSDRELRLKYLQARDNWFDSKCDEQSSSFEHVVSVYCQGLPMIFNEYKSIFNDSGEVFTRDLIRFSTTDLGKEDGAIINSWLLLKTSIFIASLQAYLDTIDQTPTMLDDIQKKCSELTSGLASIGFDFSSLLDPIFSRAREGAD